MRLLFPLAMFSLAMATSAPAAVVFSDGFEGDSGVPTTALAKWNVVGTVDVVNSSNPFGITVSAPASGKVVDLDGSPGPGEIVMKNAFAFNAGDTVKLSFVLGGSQRRADTDAFFTRLIFGGPGSQAFSNGVGTGVLSSVGGSGFWAPTLTLNRNIASTMPFGTSTLSFVAGNAGTIRLAFGTSSRDNVGPLLDNVSLDIAAPPVPEPATWAMMIAGFGLIGGAMRRVRRATRTASALG